MDDATQILELATDKRSDRTANQVKSDAFT